MNFATEKFANTFGDLFREFALNLCPAVVDATRDKLKITGFGVQSAGFSSYPPEEGRDEFRTLSGEIERIWRTNRMAVRCGEVHKEVLRSGDAYLIVWPGDDGLVRIFPNSAETCTVQYDDEDPGPHPLGSEALARCGQTDASQSFLPGSDREIRLEKRAGRFSAGCEEFCPSRQSGIRDFVFTSAIAVPGDE